MSADPNHGLYLSDLSTVVSGYSGKTKTLLDLMGRWAWAELHPELRRRLLMMWFSHPDAYMSGRDDDGLPIWHTTQGIGGGARDPAGQLIEFKRRHTTTPNGRSSRKYLGVRYYLRPGMAPYAPPGSSNHEDDTFEGKAMACDAVGWEDHWVDANCPEFGLKNFGGKFGPNVNGEEWHFQVVEFGNSKSQLLADARSTPLPVWPLSGVFTPPAPEPPVITPIVLPDPEVPDVAAPSIPNEYDTARFVRPLPYANVFCVAAGIGGRVEAVSQDRIAELVDLGVDGEVFELAEYEPRARSYARRAGLNPDDSTEFWRVGEYGA